MTIYSRNGCHLCEVAEATVREVKAEIDFTLEVVDVDSDPELVREYGEEVPVVLIDGNRHDYFRVDKERFRSAISLRHQ